MKKILSIFFLFSCFIGCAEAPVVEPVDTNSMNIVSEITEDETPMSEEWRQLDKAVNQALLDRDYREAIRRVEKVVAYLGDRPTREEEFGCCYQIAYCHVMLQEPEKAIKLFIPLAEKYPDFFFANSLLATLFFRENRLDEAIRYYKKSRKILEAMPSEHPPEWFMTTNFLFGAYCIQGDWEQAWRERNVLLSFLEEHKEIADDYPGSPAISEMLKNYTVPQSPPRLKVARQLPRPPVLTRGEIDGPDGSRTINFSLTAFYTNEGEWDRIQEPTATASEAEAERFFSSGPSGSDD